MNEIAAARIADDITNAPDLLAQFPSECTQGETQRVIENEGVSSESARETLGPSPVPPVLSRPVYIIVTHWRRYAREMVRRTNRVVRVSLVKATAGLRTRHRVASIRGVCARFDVSALPDSVRRHRVDRKRLAGALSREGHRIIAAATALTGKGGLHRIALPRQVSSPTWMFFAGIAVGAVFVSLARVPSCGTTPASPLTEDTPGESLPVQSITTPPIQLDAQNAVPPTTGQNVAPMRPLPFRGSLAVTSRPEGAAVFINGRQVGTTPVVLRQLPAGSRAIRVVLEGHNPWSRSIQVVADQRTTITATLEQSSVR